MPYSFQESWQEGDGDGDVEMVKASLADLKIDSLPAFDTLQQKREIRPKKWTSDRYMSLLHEIAT